MPPLAKVAAITAIVSQLASMEQHYPKEAHRSFNIIFLREIKREREREKGNGGKEFYLEIEIHDFS